MTTTTTPTSPATGDDRAGSLVHRPVRAYPRPLPATELAVAAPPTVGWTASGAAGWLQYLVPLLGGGGSVAFLLAVPGPRSGWLVALVVGAAVASVAAGLGLRLVERRAARRARRRERARYLAHLEQVTFQADRLAAAQLAVAEHLHPDLPTLWTTVDRTDRLWERRTGDSDFLTVRVGRDPVPLAAPARLDTAAGPLLDYDPELLQAAEDLVRRATWLLGAPVVVPLRQHAVVALTGPPAGARALARSMLCELAAFHAPDDLRVLAVHPPTAGPVWAWMQHLPHARDPTAATGPTAASLLAAARTRPGDRPHLVAIVDATEGGPGAGPSGSPQRTSAPGRSVRGATVEELLEPSASDNVTILWLAATTADEPSELSLRVRLDDQGFATLLETIPGGRRVTGIRADSARVAFCETVARRLTPLRLHRPPAPAARTGPVRLLDLLDLLDPVPDPGGLPSRPGPSLLQVPVGVTPAGDPLVLDLKEAAEGGIGPHGLVVGATGSGKSELLRTIVAGLAATHPPEQLGFVLVDFKGGAAFADLARLPQVAGLITNLQADPTMVDRAMAALQGSWPGASGCCTCPATSPTCAPTPLGARPTRGSSRCRRCWSWWTSSASCWPPAPGSSTCSPPSAGSGGASACTCCSPPSVSTRAACAASKATSGSGSACGPSAPPSPRL